jgi:hypothetical protein
MTLHPDVFADLLVLYHAGEASQASRALLEQEAARNPEIAAALTARSRTLPEFPASPALDERKVFRKVRLRYQAISFGLLWTLALIGIVLIPRIASTGTGVQIAMAFMPFAVLVLFFAGAVGALYFFIRVVR